MSNHTEIRWHGRGGQGAKTAALLLADVAFKPESMYRVSRSTVRSAWARRSLLITESVQM